MAKKIAKIKVSRRLQDVNAFHVMSLMAEAKKLEAEGHQVIHMEMGEPDFSTPQPIIDAGIESLQSGLTHYTPTLGLPALREAIAKFYLTEYQITVSPEQIIVTPGSATALQLVLTMMVSNGDAVAIPDPAYPSTHNLVRLLGGNVLHIPVNEDSTWQLTAELIEEYWDEAIKAVLIASPANPTGTILEDEQLNKIADFCESKGVFLLLDEIYHGLVYDYAPKSAVGINDNTFVINSFSKFYGMTGWRVGWIVSPKDYLDELNKLAQHTFLAAPTPGQYAALAAFSDETHKILIKRRDEFKVRRDYLYEALLGLGFKVQVKPQGAFYIYADCSELCSGLGLELGNNSFEFSRKVLQEKHVALTPGIDFGIIGAEQHVRFAYTTNIENLKIGVQRLSEFLN